MCPFPLFHVNPCTKGVYIASFHSHPLNTGTKQRLSKSFSSDAALTITEKKIPNFKMIPSPKVFMQQKLRDIWALPPSQTMQLRLLCSMTIFSQ